MNKQEQEVVYKNSFPLSSIMFLILFTLKLTNVISWSWWWVTAPLWAPVIVALTILFLLFLFGAIIGGISKLFE